MNCPHCGTHLAPAAILKAAASLSAAKRKTHKGNAKVMRPCKICGGAFGAREMRKHMPECRKTIRKEGK